MRVSIVRNSRERLARDLGQRAGELDAGRPAADEHERQQLAAAGRSVSRSARSNATRIRRRIASASSSVFRPGACGAHSSWPK